MRKIKRFLSAMLALVMVLGVLAVPSIKAEAASNQLSSSNIYAAYGTVEVKVKYSYSILHSTERVRTVITQMSTGQSADSYSKTIYKSLYTPTITYTLTLPTQNWTAGKYKVVSTVEYLSGSTWYTSSNPCTTYVELVAKPRSPLFTSGKTISKGTIRMKWQEISTAKGYQIQISTSSNFTSGKTTTYSPTGNYKNFTSLKKGTKYYFRVRCYKVVGGKKFYSAWSTKKGVTCTM